jgi:hypothetical protein
MARYLRGVRYLREGAGALAQFIVEELPYLDFDEWRQAMELLLPTLGARDMALLGCNDRFFLMVVLLGRRDALHPWIYDRCREVEADPDGYLDLWSRGHYKTSVGTTAGTIQEVMVNPELTVAIFSHTKPIAVAFLKQIMNEFERNDLLRDTYEDVIWRRPRVQAPRWSMSAGIVLRRSGNPKEGTIEAHGLVDGMPTSRHFDLIVYDDVVTRESVTNPEMVRKTTEAWELSDNLGTADTRKWHYGTRYSFSDSYGIMLERQILKARVYAATDNGKLDGKPVLLTQAQWDEKKKAQRSTISAQMLQNPTAGKENMFRPEWLRAWQVRPQVLNVYIMCDPSRGRSASSDRTAMAVIGIDRHGMKYLIDGYRHRMSLSQRWAALRGLYLKYSKMTGVQTVNVGYERYGQQTDDEYFQERMREEKISFPIKELNWTRDGTRSKADRVGRLEPDFRLGRFLLPAVVYSPNGVDRRGGAWVGDCLWQMAPDGSRIDKRRFEGPTRTMRSMIEGGFGHLVSTAIRRRDEDGAIYDVTLALMEEMMFFPFAPKDDLVDAASRIYDMEPVAPDQAEDDVVERMDRQAGRYADA